VYSFFLKYSDLNCIYEKEKAILKAFGILSKQFEFKGRKI
jgi:hypothetical protein